VSYYDVLGVAPDADAAAIRRAYVELARRYHPDFHLTADHVLCLDK
jgi:curved DNA-binding protein